jgi:light-harvesting complex I chlorophyll a/b binding protein 1
LKLGAKPANLEKYKVNELKNGRLAMLAFSGIVTQAALTGKGFPCKHNYFIFPMSFTCS